MSLRTLYLTFCILGIALARSAQLSCTNNAQCKLGNYCLTSSGKSICTSCKSCSEDYNRQDLNVNGCIKSWSDCGQCLAGFSIEYLSRNRSRDECVPNATESGHLPTTARDGLYTNHQEEEEEEERQTVELSPKQVIIIIVVGLPICIVVFVLLARCLSHVLLKRQNRADSSSCGDGELLNDQVPTHSIRDPPPPYFNGHIRIPDDDDVDLLNDDERASQHTLHEIVVHKQVGNEATPFNSPSNYNRICAFNTDPNEDPSSDNEEVQLNQFSADVTRDPGSPTGSHLSGDTEPSGWEPTTDGSSTEDEDDNNGRIRLVVDEANESGYRILSELAQHDNGVLTDLRRSRHDSGFQTHVGTMYSNEGSQLSLPSTTQQMNDIHSHLLPSPSGSCAIIVRDDIAIAQGIRTRHPKAPSCDLVPRRSFSCAEVSSTANFSPLAATTTTATATTGNRFKRSISNQQDQEQPTKRTRTNDANEN